jgi:hypothetical protein
LVKLGINVYSMKYPSFSNFVLNLVIVG